MSLWMSGTILLFETESQMWKQTKQPQMKTFLTWPQRDDWLKLNVDHVEKSLTHDSVILRRLIGFGAGLVPSLSYYIFLFTPQTLSKQLASFGQRDWTTKYFDWNLMLFGNLLNYIFIPPVGGAGSCQDVTVSGLEHLFCSDFFFFFIPGTLLSGKGLV